MLEVSFLGQLVVQILLIIYKYFENEPELLQSLGRQIKGQQWKQRHKKLI